ncbi:penicillin-binding protein activator [uncultured Rhodospira sp.]|uniref:ABC transporter substrate-binding protein n=1 Tax=uncultured Rhodospira sp. TaxID=1936189 RepID=UPI00260D6CC8|nr:penicillin-binding protein activator [uncultured Rhodospira sp.]
MGLFNGNRAAWGRLVGLALAAGLLAGCETMPGGTARDPASAPPPEPDAQAEAQKPAPPKPVGPTPVALLVPLSGPQADTGARLRAAAMQALTPERAAVVRLDVHDTASTPEGARAAAHAAVAQGAKVVLGPVYSVTAQAAKPILAGAGIPILALSNNPAVAGEGLFLLGHLPGQQAEVLLDYAAAQGHGRIALVGPDTAYARLVADETRRHAARGRVQLVDSRLFPPQTEYDSQVDLVREVAEIGPTGVIIPTSGLSLAGLSALFTYYDAVPPEVRLLGTDLWHRAETYAEGSLHGAWYVTATIPPSTVDEAVEETSEDTETDADAGADAGDPEASGGTAPDQTSDEMSDETSNDVAPAPSEGAAEAGDTDDAEAAPDKPADEPGDEQAEEEEDDTPPLQLTAGPGPLDRLMMDAVALAAAWAAERSSGAASAGTDAFLVDPAGFRGFSGLFRLLPSGLNERGLNVLEVTPDGPRMVRPAPPSFASVRPPADIIGPADVSRHPWLAAEQGRPAPAADAEPPAIEAPMTEAEPPQTAPPGATDACRWERTCIGGTCRTSRVCGPTS